VCTHRMRCGAVRSGAHLVAAQQPGGVDVAACARRRATRTPQRPHQPRARRTALISAASARCGSQANVRRSTARGMGAARHGARTAKPAVGVGIDARDLARGIEGRAAERAALRRQLVRAALMQRMRAHAPAVGTDEDGTRLGTEVLEADGALGESRHLGGSERATRVLLTHDGRCAVDERRRQRECRRELILLCQLLSRHWKAHRDVCLAASRRCGGASAMNELIRLLCLLRNRQRANVQAEGAARLADHLLCTAARDAEVALEGVDHDVQWRRRAGRHVPTGTETHDGWHVVGSGKPATVDGVKGGLGRMRHQFQFQKGQPPEAHHERPLAVYGATHISMLII
jgi:hypothetical protein